jgi:anti-sigma regulatory factor (Ser/Thr protein kinase)
MGNLAGARAMPDMGGSFADLRGGRADVAVTDVSSHDFTPGDLVPGDLVPGAGDGATGPRPIGGLLALLFQSCGADCKAGCETLRPLWAEEVMHRSFNFLRFALLLEHRIPVVGCADPTEEGELALATGLVALYRSLVAAPERQVVPCTPMLRDLTIGLVGLFGPTVGAVELDTAIERIELPGFQRRALVLAASELVMNALCHAFAGRGRGRLTIELVRTGSRHARLRVADDGIGYAGGPANVPCGIADGLASLLASSLVYRRRRGGGTVAEIKFALND